MKTRIKIPRFTIILRGSDKGGKMRLAEFINSLEAIVAALRDAEKRISGKNKSAIQYKIVGLSQNSPATIKLEPIVDLKNLEFMDIDFSEPFNVFMSNLKYIKGKKAVPENMDYHAIEKYIDISNLRTGHLADITVKGGRKKVLIDDKFEKNIRIAVGEDEFESDTLVGELDAINIHGRKVFYIYPLIGAAKIKCIFNEQLLETVRGALGGRVEVAGRVRYKSWDKFPYAMNVEKIVEVYPKDEELPTFSDIVGADPGITGGIDVTEFVRKLRDE